MAKLMMVFGLLAAAATALRVSPAGEQIAEPIGAWTDLFQPPYTAPPGEIMAISCLNQYDCYIPGGKSGSGPTAGFDVYHFDGVANGVFTPVTMPSRPLMIMAMGLKGHPNAPHGAVGGMGIGNGVQYPINNHTFETAHVPSLMVVTQDIRTSPDGKEVLVVDNAGSNAVLYSSDAGASFAEKYIKVALAANCTFARYASVINAKTWYVTMGSWPNDSPNAKKSADAWEMSARVSMVRDPITGKVQRVARKVLAKTDSDGSWSSSSSSSEPWSINTAQIVKTTDGGATWVSQFSEASSFYFNGIECVSPTHCFAVGEGMNAGAGVHIYSTTDGNNWKQIWHKPSTSTRAYSLMSISQNDKGHLFAAGSVESQLGSNGYILVSVDGGKTWTEETPMANIAEITDLDFVAGGIGFGSAVTTFETSTILKYLPAHHGPTVPPPPPGPTEATFTQMDCQNQQCSVGCHNVTFVAGQCLRVQGGGSAKVHCTATQLVQEFYQTQDCTGAAKPESMPLDQCLKSGSGGYFENFCNGAHSAGSAVKQLLTSWKH